MDTTKQTPADRPRRIAVIGSGIAGVASAWLLGGKHEVTLFEKNDYLGGHTHTHRFEDQGHPVSVDTGFIVFNRPNYPHLTGLLSHLGIATQPTQMSFGVSLDQGRLEYGGSDLSTLFAQKINLIRPRFITMVRDILRFNREGKAALRDPAFPKDESLGDFLERRRFGVGLRDDYLLPMAAAIWSCPTEVMLEFPALSFLQFFENHGLMNVNDRPQWETIKGGSRSYIDAMIKDVRFNYRLNCPINRVIREPDGIYLPETSERFDACIFAGHADQTLAVLDETDAQEQGVLGAFRFQENQAYLHHDKDLMPRRRAVWSSWNYLGQKGASGHRAVAVTYWMNHLQQLDTPSDWLVTLNPFQPPRAELIRAKITYHHPVFDAKTSRAQQQLPQLQGHRNCYYAGAWTGYGFHEDGLRSAVNIALAFGITPPWQADK